MNEALLNDGKNPFYSYDDFIKFRDHSSPYTHPSVNWCDELMNKNSTTQSYNLNATGGNKYAQYFISVGYVGENGLFKNPGGDAHDTNMTFDRYMISSKVNINITDDLIAKVTLMGRIEEGTQPGGTGNGYDDILSSIYSTPSNAYPVTNPDGSWGGSQSFNNNLLSQTINSGYITDGARDVLGAINLRYDFGKLVKGLSVRMVGSVTSQNRSTTKRTKLLKFLIILLIRMAMTFILGMEKRKRNQIHLVLCLPIGRCMVNLLLIMNVNLVSTNLRPVF